MKAKIVIGANFGDEGKGLVTDYLCAHENQCVVVRFNGGAQAGHTVLTPDGKRHVFSHFGAGTYSNAPTFLSQYFVVNPFLFVTQYFVVNPFLFVKELQLLGNDQRPTYVDARAQVTTPYDILINQAIEQKRGNGRHGSCGVGIGETVERSLNHEFQLTVKNVIDGDIVDRLTIIRDQWVPIRCSKLGVQVEEQLLFSDRLMTDYLQCCARFTSECILEDDESSLYRCGQTLIFEGAQGLLLDEMHKWFPYVTRSRTGVHNAISILDELGIEEAEVYYVTRAYLTRHGAGPLPFETPQLYDTIDDPTNQPHTFQGNLRFAPFNLDLFKESVDMDLDERIRGVKLRPNVVVTCMDQVPTKLKYVDKGGIVEDTELLQKLNRLWFESLLVSNGPTRSTVWEL